MQDVLELLFVFFLGLISPGPDFAVVSARASQYGRRAGVWTALGIASGVWILVFACCFGLQSIFTTYPELTSYMQFFGALFLGYLGLKALFKSQHLQSSAPTQLGLSNKHWLTGLLTNVTNAKAILFISGVLSQKSEYLQTIDHVLLITGLITVGTFIWFSGIALLFSMRGGSSIRKLQVYVPKVMGVFLLYLAVTFFVSSGFFR
jgi:threonine/homoserine/homoserine lactone efflux protein